MVKTCREPAPWPACPPPGQAGGLTHSVWRTSSFPDGGPPGTWRDPRPRIGGRGHPLLFLGTPGSPSVRLIPRLFLDHKNHVWPSIGARRVTERRHRRGCSGGSGQRPRTWVIPHWAGMGCRRRSASSLSRCGAQAAVRLIRPATLTAWISPGGTARPQVRTPRRRCVSQARGTSARRLTTASAPCHCATCASAQARRPRACSQTTACAPRDSSGSRPCARLAFRRPPGGSDGGASLPSSASASAR
jgi:hypothetical protein